MSNATEIKLSVSPIGRIILHLFSLKKDKKFAWHFRGILRELVV